MAAVAMLMLAEAAKGSAGWTLSYRPLKGEYAIYGGQLGETRPPSRADRKLSMMITGQLAREIFDSMGPDIKDTRGADEGGRVRRKQQVSCTYHPRDEFICYLGVNLKTGEVIPGSIC